MEIVKKSKIQNFEKFNKNKKHVKSRGISGAKNTELESNLARCDCFMRVVLYALALSNLGVLVLLVLFPAFLRHFVSNLCETKQLMRVSTVFLLLLSCICGVCAS